MAEARARTARLIVILTFVAVALLSPVSVVVALGFGWSASGWLAFWLRYVFAFIAASMATAVAGFAAAFGLMLRVEGSP